MLMVLCTLYSHNIMPIQQKIHLTSIEYYSEDNIYYVIAIMGSIPDRASESPSCIKHI